MPTLTHLILPYLTPLKLLFPHSYIPLSQLIPRYSTPRPHPRVAHRRSRMILIPPTIPTWH